MRIFKVLDASTAHLPLMLREDSDGRGDWPLGIVRYQVDVGFMVWVPDEPLLEENLQQMENREEGEPYWSNYQLLLFYQVEARKLGCDYIWFDRDAEVEDWPTFGDEAPRGRRNSSALTLKNLGESFVAVRKVLDDLLVLELRDQAGIPRDGGAAKGAR